MKAPSSYKMHSHEGNRLVQACLQEIIKRIDEGRCHPEMVERELQETMEAVAKYHPEALHREPMRRARATLMQAASLKWPWLKEL